MPYIANTEADRRSILDAIGVTDMEALWDAAGITENPPDLSGIPTTGRAEPEVLRILGEWAASNRPDLSVFAGGGAYDHVIPAAVSHIVERGEFLTSYTPYQPEASQGTLQAVYEYQSAIARLTGLPVSNASLYDGGTALFEAILMGLRAGRGRRILVAGSVSPIYQRMLRTSLANVDAELEITADRLPEGTARELAGRLDGAAAVVVQVPDFFGNVYDWTKLVSQVHAAGAVAICSVYPIALSVLIPPGSMGFDIVTGEGQCLGNPLSFGGPYLGFMATTEALMRRMPGRVCGRTVDARGIDGYVLTLQAREQHIRREKATSNICTNESLCALRAIIYLSLLGKTGFQELGRRCMAGALFLKDLLTTLPGVSCLNEPGFFNEFTIELPVDASVVAARLLDEGLLAGLPLGSWYPDRESQMLVAVTEKRNCREMEAFRDALEAAL